MDIPWVRFVSQTGVYLTFALCLAWAARRGAREWAPLLGAFLYAVLFEHWNMLRYAQVQGGYHYHVSSWLWVWGDVPLYIPLAWAFILATSRAITDQLRLPFWARPCSDALLALLIDASMDAVAIRLRFWYWHGVGLQEGFFGVPADNFLGWLLVTLTFSALTRWLWARVERASEVDASPRSRWPAIGTLAQFVAVPPLAYGAYLVLEAVVHLQYGLFRVRTLHGQLLVLAGVVALFMALVAIGLRRRVDAAGSRDAPAGRGFATHAPRHIFHFFGLLGLLCVPANLRSPALWSLAGGVWAIELAVALFAGRSAWQARERN